MKKAKIVLLVIFATDRRIVHCLQISEMYETDRFSLRFIS